jgi:alkylhydroperoxidase family enzyme
MLRGWLDFAWPLRLEAKTPRALRELLILRGAWVSKTGYEWAHHVPMALAAGVSAERVEAVKHWQESNVFAQAERAVLQMADEVTLGPGASAACVERLKTHFDASQITELVLTASFYVCVSRLLSSAGVELEADFSPPDMG